MRRADRLFQIIQILRRRRVTTAARLAEELEVSIRTVYRDIRDLIVSGVPIEGEAGVGYALPRSFDLPPLMFTREEIEALVLGVRLVESQGDPALRRAAADVLAKVACVLPADLEKRIHSTRLFAPYFTRDKPVAAVFGALRSAVETHEKVMFSYTRIDGEQSTRTVRPLCLAYLAPNWLLAGWCELREDFRNFRLDRIEALTLTGELFQETQGQDLKTFLRKVNGHSP
jgi:predicted DNA-binding transcriptional regulator YafY